jgi:formylglycine-generating enzyme required for sulfatase activity
MLRVPGGMPPRGESPAEPTRVRPFCIDRWEASLIDKRTGASLSPYYPPERRLAVQIATTWEKQRLEVGGDDAREMPLPALPAWQRQRDVEPVAVSRPRVVPNGYLSGLVAERACRNAGKRLCHHDEWVVACEGDKRQRYPYGAEYKQGACNIFRALHPALQLHDNPSVGHLDPRLNLVKEPSGDPLLHLTGTTLACRSTWGEDGAWDMNGNLDEWVEDDRGRFDGGFFSRSKREGCEQSVTAHRKDYFDYSTGARCCWAPGDGAPP